MAEKPVRRSSRLRSAARAQSIDLPGKSVDDKSVDDDPTNSSTTAQPQAALKHHVPTKDVLLIKNLRFLDLDLLPDWPRVTTGTFKTRRDSRQHQKASIAGAEWVLYRLFEIWDRNETRNKFEPFFPALEPLQSIKLRSALFQSLNNLKHHGVLGRECVLRKSLLDDCQGDKFEELLYSFSTAVLRKVTFSSRNSAAPTIGEQLAAKEALSDEDVKLLEPLSLVYREKLARFFKLKELQRNYTKELEYLIREKHSNCTSKTTNANERFQVAHEALVASGVESDGAMRKQIRHNVICDQDWLNLILHGNHHGERDSIIEDDYEYIWKTIQKGDHPKYTVIRQSLRTDLEQRVQRQQERLQKWRALQAEVSSRNEQFIVPTPKRTPQRSPSKPQRPTSLKASHRKTASAAMLSTPNPRAAALSNLSRLRNRNDEDTPSKTTQSIPSAEISTPQPLENPDRINVATASKPRTRSLSPRKADHKALPIRPLTYSASLHTATLPPPASSLVNKSAQEGSKGLMEKSEKDVCATPPSSKRAPPPEEFKGSPPRDLEETDASDEMRMGAQIVDARRADFSHSLRVDINDTPDKLDLLDKPTKRDLASHLDTLSKRTRQTLNPNLSTAEMHPDESRSTNCIEPRDTSSKHEDSKTAVTEYNTEAAPLSLAERTRASVLLMSTSKAESTRVMDSAVESTSKMPARSQSTNKPSKNKRPKHASRVFPVNPFDNDRGAACPETSRRAGSQSPTRPGLEDDSDVIREERGGLVMRAQEGDVQGQDYTLDDPFVTRSKVRRSLPSSPIDDPN